MHFNLIAALLAAVAFTFTVAVTDHRKPTKSNNSRATRLADAPPVRGSKKHKQSSSTAKSSKIDSRPSFSIKKSHTSRALTVSESSSPANDKTKICTRKLEAILFSPPSTVKDYLAKIADEMRADIQVIMAAFAGGNLDYLRTYVNRYNIFITLSGPFGQPVLIASDFVAYTANLMTVGLAQTYSGRDGFYVDTANQFYNYQFTLMSTNGQLLSFILSLPLSAMTNAPTYCK
jgi:hypothetical protein